MITAESDEFCISDCGPVNIYVSCWEPLQQIAISKKKIKKIALVQVQKIATFGHELLATQLDNVTTTQQNSTIIILRPLARRWCEKRLS